MRGLVVMAGCQVLDCTRAGVDVWVEPSKGWGEIRAEWLVCEAHHLRLSDGAAFFADLVGERRVLLVADGREPRL